MSDPCKKCGRYAEDATWWDKIPPHDRSLVACGLIVFGFMAFLLFLAAL